jgi:peptidoglycan DL-endopeptidase CwlO
MRLVICLVFLPLFSFGQIKEFDNLELLYDQGHYARVYRKANRLLNNPEYDYSLLPKYYKSISMFQLYRNEKWRRKNSSALDEAVELFIQIRKEDQGGRLINAHYYEIQSLKKDLLSFSEGLKQQGDLKLKVKINEAIQKAFQGITGLEELESVVAKVDESRYNKGFKDGDVRPKLVEYAQTFVGTPYRPGGMDTQGFDCSGFTCFVFKEFKIELPRIARDQQRTGEKIKIKDAQPGDLVFFDSGGGVNHVGIVVLNQNGMIKMVHSSTSQGIVITDIESSAYWNKRLHSVASFLK